MKTANDLSPVALAPAIRRTFELAASKNADIEKNWDPKAGTPVFTVKGKYTSRGWTEWTQGFQYGNAILTFDITGDEAMLKIGRERTVKQMLPHVSHHGVHDHGFNNLSTYGNLRRLMLEGKIPHNEWELAFYETAIKVSGATQAFRWSGTHPSTDEKKTAGAPALGYVYSFNGPHSLFVDTMRTIRILNVAWQLGHALMHEGDRKADLLKRSVLHGLTTNQHIIFHGDSTQTYDVRGRTAHEAVFNRNDGQFRTRATQQGYSAFSTWTRGLAWAMLGYAEELEFIKTISDEAFKASVGLDKAKVAKAYELAARDTCDHYIDDCAAADGIVYWDDGAPGLAKMGDWKSKAADPFNDFEPVDSSASAIAAQGLVRLGNYLGKKAGAKYLNAGLTIAARLMSDDYLATDKKHQGLLLHSVYHRPNNWDYIPPKRKVPCGESSLWGDYHLLELALTIHRMNKGETYYVFFDRK